MSVIAGLFSFDRNTESAVQLDGMTRAARRISAGRHRIQQSGLVRMLAVSLADEDVPGLAQAPLENGATALLAWDGRLDNRVDLLTRYQTRASLTSSDAEIALSYLLNRQTGGFADLDGDWSAAYWSPQDHMLCLASDFFGARPLYYRTLSTGIAWASSIEVLLELGESDLDKDFLLGFIAAAPPRYTTAYSSIKLVPPGQMLLVRPDAPIEFRDHWTLPYASLHKATRDEYHDELRRLLTEAVQVRLRSRAPAWITLSGGYDSSAVFCLADRLVRAGAVTTPALRAISRVSRGSRESDETRFIEAVMCDRPWPSYLFDADETGDQSFTRGAPDPCRGFYRECLTRMHTDRSTTLMFGDLGDTVMANYRDYSSSLATEWQAGKLKDFVSGARAWARASKGTVWKAMRTAIAMTRPAEQRRREFVANYVLAPNASGTTPERAAEMLALPLRLGTRACELLPSAHTEADAWPDAGRRQMVESIHAARIYGALRTPEYLASLRVTTPFTYRPLVQFVLSVPHDVLCRPGEPRAAMKAALADVLPPAILRRFSKGHAEPVLVRELRPRMQRFYDHHIGDLRVAQLGLVDPARLRDQLGRFLGGSQDKWHHLESILTIEEWLEFLETPARTADSVDLLQECQ